MSTPPAPKRRRLSPPQSQTPRAHAPQPNRPRVTKPFKSPLQPSKSPLPKTRSESHAQGGSPLKPSAGTGDKGEKEEKTPRGIAERKTLLSEISILEQAVDLLFPSSSTCTSSPSTIPGTKAHIPREDRTCAYTADGTPYPRADARLDELTSQWRAAGRVAAEAVFEDMAVRVREMGGIAAMRRRGREVNQENKNGEEGEQGREEEEDEQGEEEEGFTLGTMLDTMHVAHGILRWDEGEQDWAQ